MSDTTTVDTVHQPITEADVAPKRELTALDRCDRCRAQAYVVVRTAAISGDLLQPWELLFCGHHFAQHEAALFLDGWSVVVDERAKLLAYESGEHA